MKKIYWTLKEISEDIEIPYHIVRYWEQQVASLCGVKKKNGQRTYTSHHLELYRLMKKLIYEDKLTMSGAKKQLNRQSPVIKKESSISENKIADEIVLKDEIILSRVEFNELLQIIRLMIDVIRN